MTRPLPSQKRRARERKLAAARWLIENTDIRTIPAPPVVWSREVLVGATVVDVYGDDSDG